MEFLFKFPVVLALFDEVAVKASDAFWTIGETVVSSVLVLGKFGLVRFEPFLAKPETEWFGFSQDLPKPNLNRLKPFQIGFKWFETN